MNNNKKVKKKKKKKKLAILKIQALLLNKVMMYPILFLLQYKVDCKIVTLLQQTHFTSSILRKYNIKFKIKLSN